MENDWKAKLKEAKELFDDGLISEEQYHLLREEAFALRSSNKAASNSAPSLDTFAGETSIPKNISDTFAGGTRQSLAPSSQQETFAGITMMGKKIAISEENISQLPSGTLFDERYSIISLLGKGGMGVVYKAIDTKIDQIIALKVLPPNILQNQDMIANLTAEAALGQRLNHPNLLQIRHLELRDDSSYLIMELMDEGDLDELLGASGGKLEQSKALEILKKVGTGLEKLHQEKIIHLDLKPQNVLLGKDGQVKLADFGISSRLKDQRGGHSGAGTLFYAPPEQLKGESCDVRADIYALGLMTCKLLSGRFPFETNSIETIRAWHFSGVRDFSFLDHNLASILSRSCAINPEERFRSTKDFLDSLNRVLSQSSWFPASISPKQAYASAFLIDNEEVNIPLSNYFSAGYFNPSSTLREGKILLQTSSFALGERGDAQFLPAPIKKLWSKLDLTGQDTLKIPKLSSQQEAHLAISLQRKDNNVSIRRLFYAEERARTTQDWLTIAWAQKIGFEDQEGAKKAFEKAEQSAQKISEQLELAHYLHWIEQDPRATQKLLLKLEQNLSTLEDYKLFAIAQACTTQDWKNIDNIVTIALSKLSIGVKDTLNIIDDWIHIFALREPFIQKIKQLEEKAETPNDLILLSEFWLKIEQPKLAQETKQKSFRLSVKNETKKLTPYNIPSDPPTGILNIEQVKEYQNQVGLQLNFRSQAQILDKQAQVLHLDVISWKLPYSQRDLDARKKEIDYHLQATNKLQILIAEAEKIGWNVEFNEKITEEIVQQFTLQLEEQKELLKEYQALLKTNDIGFWQAGSPDFPLTKEKINQLKAQVPDFQRTSKAEEQIKRAEQLGWEIKLLKSYSEQELNDLIAYIDQQFEFHSKCQNHWNIPLFEFPLTQEEYDDFQWKLNQQQQWEDEIDELHQQSGFSLGISRPDTPYTQSGVDEYKKKVENKIRSKKRNRKILIFFVGFISLFPISYFFTLYQEAVEVEKEAKEIGWDLSVSIFDIEDSKYKVQDSKYYYKDATRLNKEAEALGFPGKYTPPYTLEKTQLFEVKLHDFDNLQTLKSAAKKIGWEIENIESLTSRTDVLEDYTKQAKESVLVYSKVQKIEEHWGSTIVPPYTAEFINNLYTLTSHTSQKFPGKIYDPSHPNASGNFATILRRKLLGFRSDLTLQELGRRYSPTSLQVNACSKRAFNIVKTRLERMQACHENAMLEGTEYNRESPYVVIWRDKNAKSTSIDFFRTAIAWKDEKADIPYSIRLCLERILEDVDPDCKSFDAHFKMNFYFAE